MQKKSKKFTKNLQKNFSENIELKNSAQNSEIQKKLTIFEKIQLYTMSALWVVFFSLIFVAMGQNIESTKIMASVTNLNNNSSIIAHFDSDIVLEFNENNYNLIAGSDMKNVDLIEGIIIHNPEENLEITTQNSDSLNKMDNGIYRFSINMNGKNISKWTIIEVFSSNIAQKSEIILTDTQFVSDGIRYNLTNNVK